MQAETSLPIRKLRRNGGFGNATLHEWCAKFGGIQALLQAFGEVNPFPDTKKDWFFDGAVARYAFRHGFVQRADNFSSFSWLNVISIVSTQRMHVDMVNQVAE